MLHKVLLKEHTIHVVYKGLLTHDGASAISLKIIELFRQSSYRLNVILYGEEVEVDSIRSVISAGSLLMPHVKKMNYCYVVGAQGIKKNFAKMLLKIVGANSQKVLFVDELEKAIQDIDVKWKKYRPLNSFYASSKSIK